jgi:hypothetical protein
MARTHPLTAVSTEGIWVGVVTVSLVASMAKPYGSAAPEGAQNCSFVRLDVERLLDMTRGPATL